MNAAIIAMNIYRFNSSGSGESPETPIQQPYLLTFTLRTETTETITWIEPAVPCDGYLIVAKSGSAVNADPVDDTNYTANGAFGSGSQIGTGNYVVGKVASGITSLEITSLSSGTDYHFEIFAFNGSGANIKFRTIPEMGHLWAAQAAPPSGMIGTCKSSDDSIYVRTGSSDIYYSLNQGESWALWASIPGAQFHSCECCEGGTIHNAAGDSVSIKFMFNDHSGSGTIYAGYVPGDTPEEVATSPAGETWNEGSWNPITSEYCVVADSGGGGNRFGIITNARTAVFSNSLGSNSWASVTSTPGAADGTTFVVVAKNPADGTKAAAKRNSLGVWSLLTTPTSKNWHMIQWMPNIGADGRLGVTSADGTSNDSMYSDDFGGTFILGNLDGSGQSVGGSYGAWYWDSSAQKGVAVSRTANADIAITNDFITWEYITNPSTTAIWFNVMAIGDGFSIQASSGGILGAKTIPSNINNASTRFLDYTNFIANLVTRGLALPSAENQTRLQNFLYACRDNDVDYTNWFRFHGYGCNSNIGAGTVNIIDPPNKKATPINSPVFAENTGVRSGGTSYVQLDFIPSVDNASGLNNYGVTHVVLTDRAATEVDYGGNGASANQRTSINTKDTVGAGNLATVANNSTAVGGAANTNSIGIYTNNRTGSAANFMQIWKNKVVLDGSNGASAALSTVNEFDCGLNNNGALSLPSQRNIYITIRHKGMTNARIATLHDLINIHFELGLF